MISSSALKYSPLRHYKIPDKLIYQTKSYVNEVEIDNFRMFSVKNPKQNAIMRCFPTLIEREGKKVPSLYIWHLYSNPAGCGFGTELLKFAKKYSEQIGCHSYLHLCADSSWSPNRVPHIFYRKCGLSTNSSANDRELDCFIKKHKTATYRNFETMDMYYPPLVHQVKSHSSIFDLIKNFFHKKAL